MLRRALITASALLALFHVWLFAGHVASGQIGEPARLVRWGIALGLALALVALRRRGISLLRGRHAVVVWTLAALLHVPADAADIAPHVLALPETVSSVERLALVSIAGLFFLSGLLPARRPAAARRCSQVIAARTPAGVFRLTAYRPIAPRPPPSA